MSNIIDTPVVSQNNAVANSSGTKSTDSVQSEQDKFMKLLVTQLQNQDPLNPLDNAQVTSQLAQLSTVTGVNKLNDTLESLRTDQQSSQAMTATSLIGKAVLTPGKSLTLGVTAEAVPAKDGKDATPEVHGGVLGFQLGSGAAQVTVEIVDKNGKTVKTISSQDVDAGNYPVFWAGDTDVEGVQAPLGEYTVKVTASNGGDPLKDAIPLTYGVVASVSTSAVGGTKVNVSGIGKVALDDVKEVL
jgi:flagellar basal-body rod modification protein FlgD